MNKYPLTPFLVVIVWLIGITLLGIFGKGAIACASLGALGMFGVWIVIAIYHHS